MAKKVKDLPNKGHTGVVAANDYVHIHTDGRDIGGDTDFKIPFLDLFDYAEEISGAYIYRNSTQNIPANTWTEVGWSNSFYDSESYILGDWSGFITPLPGFYFIYASTELTENVNREKLNQGRILLDGAHLIGGRSLWDGHWDWQRSIQSHAMAYIEAGVEVTYQVYVQTDASTLQAGYDQNQFSIYRIGGGL